MRLFLLGKGASVNHWLEDAAAAFAAEGHEVALGLVRRPWLAARLESSLIAPIAASLRRRVARLQPDMILAMSAFHVPKEILEALSTLPRRPPIIGWVGDLFDLPARELAQSYDLIGYTDSGLLARHEAQGLKTRAFYLPHAANPSGDWPMRATRSARMAFVANPTPRRREIVAAIDQKISLYGPGWRAADRARHQIESHRISTQTVRRIYGDHLAALNIHNERNVVCGLNQRNFDPLLAGAALITEDQPDLERCFDPGLEVLAWTTPESLNDHYARVLADPHAAGIIAGRGRRRVLAEHTYGARLKSLAALV